VIQKINERFVSTTIIYSDLKEGAKSGDELAREVAMHFFGPVELMFLTPEGRFVSRLSVVQDFTVIHPDTDIRPGQKYDTSPELNVRVFLEHVDQHFDKAP
jgi:hypothetical protein